jgi:hypothetical protein
VWEWARGLQMLPRGCSWLRGGPIWLLLYLGVGNNFPLRDTRCAWCFQEEKKEMVVEGGKQETLPLGLE